MIRELDYRVALTIGWEHWGKKDTKYWFLEPPGFNPKTFYRVPETFGYDKLVEIGNRQPTPNSLVGVPYFSDDISDAIDALSTYCHQRNYGWKIQLDPNFSAFPECWIIKSDDNLVIEFAEYLKGTAAVAKAICKAIVRSESLEK